MQALLIFLVYSIYSASAVISAVYKVSPDVCLSCLSPVLSLAGLGPPLIIQRFLDLADAVHFTVYLLV